MAGNRKSSFGPGFLVTAAFIGPGTVTSCTIAGAKFGYALIYALVFAVIMTVILQEMTVRLSLASGRDLGQALREFPKSFLTRVIFVVITLTAITLGCAAYEAGNIIGGSLGLEAVTSVSQKYWVGLISLIAFLLLGRQKYKYVEKFLILLVMLMSFSFLTTFLLIKPDISSIIKGLVPTIPSGSLFLTLALIGTTVVPYNLFLHSSAVKEKWQNRWDLKSARKDLLVSIGLGGFISIAIIVTSAAAFFEHHIVISNGIQMAQQLKPLFGNLTNVLFGLGFFAAGLSSALTAPYAAAFASAGILGWKGGQTSKGFKCVWASVILVGFIVSLFNIKPLAVIIFAQVANGLILPVASVFLLIVLNNRKKMGDLANSWKQNILGGIIIVIVSFLGIWNILKLFLS